MLPLSSFTITFNKSKDYLRSAFLLYLLAIIVLLRSGLPLVMQFILGWVLILFFTKIIRNKFLFLDCQKLSYHVEYWLLYRSSGQQIKYERASICFEGGMFMMLKLSGISPSTTLVIFNDQITEAQYRMMKVSEHCINKAMD